MNTTATNSASRRFENVSRMFLVWPPKTNWKPAGLSIFASFSSTSETASPSERPATLAMRMICRWRFMRSMVAGPVSFLMVETSDSRTSRGPPPPPWPPPAIAVAVVPIRRPTAGTVSSPRVAVEVRSSGGSWTRTS